MHTFSFFFSLFVWGAIAWNEGAVDAYDYARRTLLGKTTAGDSIYGELVKKFKHRTTRGEFIFSWAVRIGTYLALFLWKALCVYKMNEIGLLSITDFRIMLSTIVFIPLLIFPFFYYTKYCEKVKNYDRHLAPKGWRDNLGNNGGVAITFKWRIILLILGLIGLTAQIVVVSDVLWLH